MSVADPQADEELDPRVDEELDPRVAAALARLGEVTDGPLAGQVAVYDDVARQLQAVLADSDGA